MITDELFTAVTGIAGSYKDYKINQITNGECYLSTHDLIHLCKEWAFSNKFIINTSRVLSEKNYSKHVVQLHHFYNPDMDRKANRKFYYANGIVFDTEPDAIFASCQWILEENINDGKYNDWRLPTIKELFTLVNYKKHSPTSDVEDTRSDYYWSSSPDVFAAGYVWTIYFNDGNGSTDYKSNKYYVRCVRDGKFGLEWAKSTDTGYTHDKAIEYAKTLDTEVYYKAENNDTRIS